MPRSRRFLIDPPDAAPLVRNALLAAGWAEAPAGADEWELLWPAAEPDAAVYAHLQPGQRVAWLPGIAALTRTDRLAATVARGLGLLEDPPPRLVPETFALPGELGAFGARAAAAPEVTWLQRPKTGGTDEDVVALAGLDEVETNGRWVVQSRVDAARTLRRLVLVTALDPLAVWVGDEHTELDRTTAAALGAARDELARTAWRATNEPAACFALLSLELAVDTAGHAWLLSCDAGAEPPSAAAARDVLGVLGLAERAPSRPPFRALLPDERLAGLLPLPRPGEGSPRRLQPAAGVAAVPLGDGIVLREPHGGQTHLLDPVGAYLWAAWSDGLEPPEIAAEVSAELPEAAWRAEADVRNALGEWLELNLAVAGRTPPRQPPAPGEPSARRRGEQVYRLVETAVGVTAPADEVEGWLDVSLGPLADDGAEVVNLRVEVGAAGSGWEVWTAGERLRCASARQVGSVVRRLVRARAAGPDTIAATLLEDGDGRGVLLVGPASLRAGLARAWLRDGGTCAGDDLVRIREDGSVAGLRAGLEAPVGLVWWGPLDGPDDPEPLLVSAAGPFAHMWWPEGAGTHPPVERPLLLRVDPPPMAGTLLQASPLAATDAFRDLLGARPAGAAGLSLEATRGAVALLETVPRFAVQVPDPSVGLSVLSALPTLW